MDKQKKTSPGVGKLASGPSGARASHFSTCAEVLLEYLEQIPDPRGRQGLRHSSAAMLAAVAIVQRNH